MFDKTFCQLLKIQKISIPKGIFADIFTKKNIATLFGSDIVEIKTLFR
jgi:hypothetical protein